MKAPRRYVNKVALHVRLPLDDDYMARLLAMQAEGEAEWMERTGWLGDIPAPRRDFEHWLIGKWLAEVRSEAFRQSAEYHYLRAEWERER